jgi:hypothetical protein
MEQVLRQVREDKNRLALQLFLYLQLLDLLTTLVGFRLGANEASPFIRMLMQFGPAWGVLISKVAAVGLGALAIALRRVHLIQWINYWYAALVVWNLFVMLSLGRAA